MGSLAENITRAWKGEWHGSYGTVPTPGHSAKDRGTTVKDADDGRDVVFSSFNGGDWRALKDRARNEGLLPEFEPSGANDRRSANWRETGRYDYFDANGVLAYRTVRKECDTEPKRFVAQRPNGQGGWASKLGDVPRIPYRLPDLIAAPADQPVYFVEGERKADRLRSMGFVATAIAFGCKGWRADYVPYFAGRTVIILPDKDEPGREFANKVRDALSGTADRVEIVELSGLPHKGDIIDWQGSADDLRAVTAKALERALETFPLADLELWARVPPTPKAFIMAPFIPRDDVVIITGDGGTNKSTAALQISACAAAGRQFLGMDVAPVPALYVTAEDDNRENHWRLAGVARAIGTSIGAMAGKLHVVSLRGRMNNELATFDHDGTLRAAPAFALLRATIEATGAKLVTLDNVAHLFAGNENDRGQVTAFINLLYKLCGDLGVTILLIAHRNKSGDSYSGSTAWLNAVRSQVLLERSDEHDSDARRMSLGKANYARAGESVDFRWHDFALVRDSDLPPEMAKEIAANAKASADNETFLRCLAQRTAERRHVSEKVGANYAPKVFATMAEAKGVKKERLVEAMDRLFRIGAIERGLLWRDTSEGKDIFGLRETGNVTGNRPETGSADDRKPAENDRKTHPLYTTYKSGAATGAAAPAPLTDLSRVVFPASDDIGDPNSWGVD